MNSIKKHWQLHTHNMHNKHIKLEYKLQRDEMKMRNENHMHFIEEWGVLICLSHCKNKYGPNKLQVKKRWSSILPSIHCHPTRSNSSQLWMCDLQNLDVFRYQSYWATQLLLLHSLTWFLGSDCDEKSQY